MVKLKAVKFEAVKALSFHVWVLLAQVSGSKADICFGAVCPLNGKREKAIGSTKLQTVSYSH
ncbi:hypothetical protein H6F76_28650 [Leptolyngbya sp. FACHB-321]|uniref:hypothetical protein n=1 Tax=Leptolyngbya sp. FACHB-321 TaxID=2692807 RepID=UPI0016868D32|nr:hypothetical protein [Leptolyngbya sp. FACHB-321]MBD2038925.1 hypothetical protein [Leptolyngbya sp. FACHB-321]